MIDEKKIEEAARKYAFNKYDSTDDEVQDTYTEELQVAFETGINWFLDNLWHDAGEEPKDKSAILLNYTGSMCKWASLDEVDADDLKQTVIELRDFIILIFYVILVHIFMMHIVYQIINDLK